MYLDVEYSAGVTSWLCDCDAGEERHFRAPADALAERSRLPVSARVGRAVDDVTEQYADERHAAVEPLESQQHDGQSQRKRRRQRRVT